MAVRYSQSKLRGKGIKYVSREKGKERQVGWQKPVPSPNHPVGPTVAAINT